MCKVEEKTYIYPDGEHRLVTKRKFCKKSDGRKLCHDHERKNAGRVWVQPDLIDDEAQPSPSSANFPPTPDSARIETREPSSLSRQGSTADRHGKRRINSGDLRIKIRRDSSTRQSGHRHTRSTSSTSSAAASSSGVPAYAPTEALFDVSPESPRSNEGSPTERGQHYQRLRPIITNARANHSGSSTGSSSRSSNLRTEVHEEEHEPRSSDSDRRRAQEQVERQERERRRQRREDNRQAQASSSTTPRPPSQEPEDEYARRDYERYQGREEQRKLKRERQDRDDRQREARERGEAQASTSARPGSSRGQRTSVHYTDGVDEFRYLRVSDESPMGRTEEDRRREMLARQMRDRRPAEEATSPRDTATADAQRRTNEVEAEQRAEYERQRRRDEARRSMNDQPFSPTGPYYPPQGFPPQVRYPQGAEGMYPADPTHEATDRAWHREDVSPRTPLRPNSSRQPNTPAGFPQRRLSYRRGSVSYPDANLELRRPGSSSSGQPEWVHDIEARRLRGDQVLANARERADAAEREARARAASQRMAWLQSHGYGSPYPEGSPEWWFIRTGQWTRQ